MDQDLKAYLDERFARVDQQVNEFRKETQERFARVDQQFTELRKETQERFGQVNQQLAQLDDFRTETGERFDRVDQRFAGLEDEVHKSGILTEGLDDKIRQVADGVAANNEKLDRFREFFSHRFLESETFQRDLHKNLRESHTKLEARVSRLEAAKRRTRRAPKD
ncbi:MAG TPA: hypothetical protein VE685_18865 [Thermoanaerobaculia bacterium]|nr:hypothetical protein [Thermoanaerobaculia bacterium]